MRPPPAARTVAGSASGAAIRSTRSNPTAGPGCVRSTRNAASNAVSGTPATAGVAAGDRERADDRRRVRARVDRHPRLVPGAGRGHLHLVADLQVVVVEGADVDGHLSGPPAVGPRVARARWCRSTTSRSWIGRARASAPCRPASGRTSGARPSAAFTPGTVPERGDHRRGDQGPCALGVERRSRAPRGSRRRR